VHIRLYTWFNCELIASMWCTSCDLLIMLSDSVTVISFMPLFIKTFECYTKLLLLMKHGFTWEVMLIARMNNYGVRKIRTLIVKVHCTRWKSAFGAQSNILWGHCDSRALSRLSNAVCRFVGGQQEESVVSVRWSHLTYCMKQHGITERISWRKVDFKGLVAP
jgi:hypothetical protein